MTTRDLAPVPPAFWVDEHDDRYYAPDRGSRFGRYLAVHAGQFLDPDDDRPTADPLLFAATAFTVAGGPFMAPGYVRTHPRVRDVRWFWDGEHRLAFEVPLLIPPCPDVVPTLETRWLGWRHEAASWAWEPPDNDRPYASTVVTARVPLPGHDLPAPRYRDGVPELATARQAVTTVVRALNGHLALLVAWLNEGAR